MKESNGPTRREVLAGMAVTGLSGFLGKKGTEPDATCTTPAEQICRPPAEPAQTPWPKEKEEEPFCPIPPKEEEPLVS